MRSVARRLRLLALLTAPFVARDAGAQPSSRQAQLRRIGELDSVLVELRDEVRRVREEAAKRQSWEVVREGYFTVRTSPDLAAPVRAAASRATETVRARGGEALHERLAARLPSAGRDSLRVLRGFERRLWLVSDTGRRGWNTLRSFAPGAPAPALERALVQLAERASLDGADSALSAWVSMTGLPLRERPPDEWSAVYRDLATSASPSARRCRRGDAVGCLESLGMLDDAAKRLDAWYDPGEFRALVAVTGAPAGDTAAVASAAACRKRGEPGACERAVRAIPASALHPPLDGTARLLLVDEIFRTGGPQAYARLMNASGPMPERLAAAAGVPLPEVVARWRERVMAARRADMAGHPAGVLAALGWCAGLLAVGCIRRSA